VDLLRRETERPNYLEDWSDRLLAAYLLPRASADQQNALRSFEKFVGGVMPKHLVPWYQSERPSPRESLGFTVRVPNRGGFVVGECDCLVRETSGRRYCALHRLGGPRETLSSPRVKESRPACALFPQ